MARRFRRKASCSPNLNITARVPTMTTPPVTTVTPRINPNVAGTAVTGIGRTTPNLRTMPACSYAYRDSDGGCSGQPVGGGGSIASGQNKGNGPRRNVVQTALDP